MERREIDQKLALRLNSRIDAGMEEVVQIRRYLHMNPEIGFDTQNTERVVREFLQREGISILPSQMGVLGLIKGRSEEMIALRADMDALCLQEENDVPYKSVCPNKMHACGHDGHTAMLLGAAKVLNESRDDLPFSVLLIFQPAEEGPNLGGARIIMRDLESSGAVRKIRCIFGMHLFNDYELGMIGVKSGSLMSSTDEFDIRIVGRGGHAGQPHETVDALSVGAKFVSDMESFMSRRKDPFDPAVCSVGIFQSGTAKNIVAETAVIAGTIRCQREGTRTLILENMERVLKGVCEAFQAAYSIDILRGIPVLRNDGEMTEYAEAAARAAVGDEGVFTLSQAMMGAEDFAYYAEKIPASFLFIGARNEEKGFTCLAHHPRFDFDEEALRTGMRMFCWLVMSAEGQAVK